jgi:hypothetical protein
VRKSTAGLHPTTLYYHIPCYPSTPIGHTKRFVGRTAASVCLQGTDVMNSTYAIDQYQVFSLGNYPPHSCKILSCNSGKPLPHSPGLC